MSNQDKIFEQFRDAAKQQEQSKFPGFEEVWQKVENRLDDKEKPKAAVFPFRRLLAVAAAAVLMLILGVAIYNSWQASPDIANNVFPQPAKPLAGNTPKDDAPGETPKTENTSNSKPALAKAGTQKGRFEKDAEPVAANVQAKDNVEAAALTIENEVLVKGVVTDAGGKPIAGASVMVEGSSRGVAADSAGRFAIKAEDTDMLAVQALGFDTKKFKANQQDQLKVTLDANTQTLSEVVVVGYGTQKKRDMTGSGTSVSGGQVSASQQQRIDQALAGKAAGMAAQQRKRQQSQQLMAANRSVAGDPTDIRIRGANSVTPGKEPLYIVNGRPVAGNALKSIDPNHIQRVDVLKDAAATSIYGSQEQNGVVVVTTKELTKKEQQAIQQMNEQWLASGVRIDPKPADIYNNGYNEDYNPLVENPFTSPATSPLSTFSIDVDNASYSNIRRFINNGQQVPRDAVRIEEMINYFKYQYDEPKGGHPFDVQTEYSDAPWNNGHKLLRIGLKAKDIPADKLPVSNLVFLIDVSGSMESPNKLPLLKSSMKVLVDQLRKEDKVSIVVYAGAAGLVLPPTSGADKQAIMDAMNKLNAGGSTAGGAGIELAYKTAQENFISEGNNRVVLATDGDFNVGINSNSDLQRMIEEKRKSGIFLTCLGFGMGNYKDSRLETLADKGNGNYAYIDNLQEANRFLGKEFKGTVFTVAKDVKLQIEFNPQSVGSYRLIGYENRLLNDEDFVNDKIDAGEMGAGHTVTALYEIIPAGVQSKFSAKVPELKYTKSLPDNAPPKELATIKFRYKKPDGDKSIEWSKVVNTNAVALDKSSVDFRFAAAVAWLGLKLRKSELIGSADAKAIQALAAGARGKDEDGYRAEFIRLLDSMD